MTPLDQVQARIACRMILALQIESQRLHRRLALLRRDRDERRHSVRAYRRVLCDASRRLTEALERVDALEVLRANQNRYLARLQGCVPVQYRSHNLVASLTLMAERLALLDDGREPTPAEAAAAAIEAARDTAAEPPARDLRRKQELVYYAKVLGGGQ